VVLARVAQRSAGQVVGTFEFRKRLGMESTDQAGGCFQDASCLNRVAVSLGVGRILTGTVNQQSRRYWFDLTWRDIATGQVRKSVFREVSGSLDELVRAAQDATDDVLTPPAPRGRVRVSSTLSATRVSIDEREVGTAPLLSDELPLGRHAVKAQREGHFSWSGAVAIEKAEILDLRLDERHLPPRKRAPALMAYGSGAAAFVALGAASILGIMASADPSFATREDAQRDFERRVRLGTSANVLLVSAAALGLCSGLLMWTYREHIWSE
jgi:hypothetical protein